MVPIDQVNEEAAKDEALSFLVESGRSEWTIAAVVEYAAKEARREMVEALMRENRGVV